MFRHSKLGISQKASRRQTCCARFKVVHSLRLRLKRALIKQNKVIIAFAFLELKAPKLHTHDDSHAIYQTKEGLVLALLILFRYELADRV
jgi:hypothetical protein